MKNKMVPTHKGLFLGCVPIFMIWDDEFPTIWARHWSLEPFFSIAELLFGICIFIRRSLDDNYEPMYPILVTGEMQ